MNISQFFVTKRPIAWTALVSVIVWGAYAYLMMPQRQDPIIPVVTGVIATPYPGAEAEKVELHHGWHGALEQSERIDIGHLMSAQAVDLDQARDGGLLLPRLDGCHRGRRMRRAVVPTARPQTLADRGDDGSMRDISRIAAE